MQHIVMFSGGVTSWATAKRVAARYGTDDLTLLFADTRMEDEDLYRFLREAAADVGGRLVQIEDGRDPWQIFFDERYLGNSRIDPCSKILKRQLIRGWLESTHKPESTCIYIGYDGAEAHRADKAKPYWTPWTVCFPLIEWEDVDTRTVAEQLEDAGIQPPRLYGLGFAHNNCGGFCIKSGQAQFKRLWETMPERYLYHEKREQELREYLGKDVAILRDRRGGKVRPLTLREFRERLERGEKQLSYFPDESCSCFAPISAA